MPNTITPFHRAIVEFVARYYAVLRTDIQAGCCPNDKDGRATRRRIGQMLEMGFIGKCRMEVVNPADHEAPMPAYYPTRKGLEWLAGDTGDESWLLKCCLPPSWMKLRHWNAIAKWHILLDTAAALRTDAAIGGWLNEWDRQRDPKGAKPDETYMLYTLVTEKPKVVCRPGRRVPALCRVARQDPLRGDRPGDVGHQPDRRLEDAGVRGAPGEATAQAALRDDERFVLGAVRLVHAGPTGSAQEGAARQIGL